MLEYVLTIIELGFFLLAIVLSIANMNERYNTNKTTTTTSEVSLSDIEFPLKLSILINPGFAEEELKKFGYDNLDDYFSGRFGYEDFDGYFSGKDQLMPVRFGWASHTEYGLTTGTASGINRKKLFSVEYIFFREFSEY